MDSQTATPDALAWVDGAIVLARDATVPLIDDGVLRGDGVFETMLVRNGLIHALPEHHARLMRSAATLGLTVPDVIDPMAELLDAYGPHNGIAKIVLLRGGTMRLMVSAPAPWPGTLSLDVQDVPWGGPLAGAKTLSYALNQFCVRTAQEHGCDDALIVHDGQVRELAHGAVVLVEDGTLVTPDPTTAGILESVTLTVLASLFQVRFESLKSERLATADELFVLSATRLAVGVSRLRFADGSSRIFDAPGPLTCDAHAALETHVDTYATRPSLR
ncbi:MAG: aminotransferase class IV [Nitriliruptoraceae bacterium]